MKIAFVTLGCKLNYAETSTYQRGFVANGLEVVDWEDKADVYLINTCSVTQHSDNKCRNIIRKLHKISPSALIAVTGCYAQLKPAEILGIEGVDIVAGARDKGNLFEIISDYDKKTGKVCRTCGIDEIDNVFPACSSGDRTRSFLKVQDGCDYYCTYDICHI